MSQDDTAAVLSINNLSKSFGANKAVDNITISVERGEVFGFLGPNGAGKSTAIRLILDILRPDSGTITIFGASNRNIRTTHKDIGYLSGDMVLDIDLTGRQYLEFLNNLHGGSYSSAIDELAATLQTDLNKKIGSYSRGNRQKIGLIAALFHDPKLLILDEPTTGFDPLVQDKFAGLIRQFVGSGGTVFMSSHVLAEVQNLCDRVAFIKGGRIISTTSVSDLLENQTKRIHITASTEAIRSMRKSSKNVPGLRLEDGMATSLSFSFSGDITVLMSYLAGKKITDITIREPELDEIFGHYYESSPTQEPSDA